jgi:hypothetical protein
MGGTNALGAGALIAMGLTTWMSTARAEDATANSIQYTVAPSGLHITEGASARDVPLSDCEPRALAREGAARVYVACGASGLIVLDATDPRNPVVTAHVPTEGDVVALHVVDGKVWAELAHVEARPAAAILRAARAVQATGPVPQVTPSAEPAAKVPTPDNARSLIAPPRRDSLWEVDLGTHAFLPIGNIGFGLLSAASAAYRFDLPIATYLEVSPAGFARGKQGTIGTAAAHALVALDAQLFELGLGIGGATLNDPTTDKTSSASFAQRARIGARDGLAFFYRSNVIVDNDKFALGSMDGLIQIAVAQRWWLLLDGGGGPIGYAYGDGGARYLVHGDLGPGSFLLTGTVGGAGMFKSTRTLTTLTGGSTYYRTAKTADYTGPALGLGLEWRL